MPSPGGSSYHAIVLDAMRRAAMNARPGQQLQAMQKAAREHGYIIVIEGTIAPGVGISAPINNASVAINVPYTYNFTSGRMDPGKFGVQGSATYDTNYWSVALTPNGFSNENMTRVSDPGLDNTQSIFGFPAKFEMFENQDKFVFTLNDALGPGIKVMSNIDVGQVGFVFADFRVSAWKADPYFEQEIRPNLETQLSLYNSEVPPNERINSTTYLAAMKGHLYDPGFTQNWQDLALLEMFKTSPQFQQPGQVEISGSWSPMIGGQERSAFFVGRRKDGTYFVQTNINPYLGTFNENEAYTIQTYRAFDANNQQIGTTSTIRYAWRLGASGHAEPDPTEGISILGANDLYNGSVDGTLQTADEGEMSAILQNFSMVFRGNCFGRGAPVLMADGTTKPIELVEVGDMVAAFDSTVDGGRGPLIACRVARTFVNKSDHTVTVGGILSTAGHPFLTPEGGFEPIAQLAERGAVDAAGNVVPIEIGEGSEGEVEVFNIEVDDLHTYVVGGFRVHNISLKLDGSEGYITFMPNGDAMGIVFGNADKLKIIDYRKSQNYARALEFSSAGFSVSVWYELD